MKTVDKLHECLDAIREHVPIGQRHLLNLFSEPFQEVNALEKSVEEKQATAIAFAEWISKNYSTYEIIPEGAGSGPLADGYFQSYDTYEVFSIEKLYTLFTQSTKQ